MLGGARFGCYATHVVAPVALLFALPPTLSLVQAAAFPAPFLTAAFATWELAHPRPKHAVLVHSAAGGVGSCLVQLTKAAGCTVVGVVGAAHKVAAVKKLGADVVIDKSTEDLWSVAEQHCPKGFHHIFDANGVRPSTHSLPASTDSSRRRR